MWRTWSPTWSRRWDAMSPAPPSRSTADCCGRCAEDTPPRPLVKPQLAARYVERGLWTNETFFQELERQAAAVPEREAFCDARGRITYRQRQERIERGAEVLRLSGIRRGDV